MIYTAFKATLPVEVLQFIFTPPFVFHFILTFLFHCLQKIENLMKLDISLLIHLFNKFLKVSLGVYKKKYRCGSRIKLCQNHTE